ncbi:hypothetical protein [Caulobacter sp. LjRoot300]|uniref:hypothetical protein n=1 Tax=Caulobacter sp. LjRoot300 TaxID=3342321 RepID=UPI003ECFBEA2
MTLSFLPEIPKIDPEKGPNLMAGAASPLWLMFGGAAMAGATWWWWSARWREAVNLEAFLAPTLTGAAPAPEPATLAPEPAIKAPIDPVTEALVLAPIDAAIAADTVAEDALDTAKTVTAEAQEALEAAVEPVAEAAKSAADDLTLLVGIGPKLAASLADLGVTRFEQIAGWGADDLADFDAKLNLRGRAERDAWIAQAKRLAIL